MTSTFLLLLGALPWALALAVWDIRQRRLPNVLTAPAAIVAVMLAVFFHPPALLGLVWPLLYLVMSGLLGGVGGGDIKLAVPLGVGSCWLGGPVATLIAMCLASAFTAGAALLSAQRTCPHGPGMLVSAFSVSMLATVMPG